MIVSIHLMLLFIYEFHTEFHLPMRFNTSHVTLYHSEAYRKRTNSTFQYISCYSLSVGDWTGNVSINDVSIHLMLLFIIPLLFCWGCCTGVSIHLMLLFIRIGLYIDPLPVSVSIHLMLLFIGCRTLWKALRQECFNTSHVTLYPSFYRLFFF